MEPTPSGRTIGSQCAALVRGIPYTATDRDSNDPIFCGPCWAYDGQRPVRALPVWGLAQG